MTDFTDVPPQQLTPGGPMHGGWSFAEPYAPTVIDKDTTGQYQGPPTKSQRTKMFAPLTDEQIAAELLRRCMPDWNGGDDHSRNTPARFVASLREQGDRDTTKFTFTTFSASSDAMIILQKIPFYTLCAHHVVPFHGTCDIGYVPQDLIAGLSKFARAVKYVAKGLWVQEELTSAVHDFLEARLAPRGLAVVMRAEHMCMAMRGVQTPGVITTTNKMTGVFADHERTAKAEFYAELNHG